MNVVAPGKLLLTGAYAVLEGAPAIVVAVDRYAVAPASGGDVDVGALHDGAQKLGLGSSASSLVASLARDAAARGEDLAAPVTRRRVFDDAWRAHRAQQGGGSGVDIAASAFGGALRYLLGSGAPTIEPVTLPPGLALSVFWSGTSARTSELRARVDDLRRRDPTSHASRMDALIDVASRASRAVDAGDRAAFIEAARATGALLEALGLAADAPIVPRQFAELAASTSAAFLPSGAGGGDVAVWLGEAPPDDAFVRRAAALGMRALPIAVDWGGVRLEPASPL